MDANATSPVDLSALEGEGPLWGMASADLNATLLAWPAGHEVAEHVNESLDVLLVVLGGSGTVRVNGNAHAIAPGQVLLIEKGATRSIAAGDAGLRYLSVHRRRGPLQIENADERTRTSTGLPPRRPERRASTSSATSA